MWTKQNYKISIFICLGSERLFERAIASESEFSDHPFFFYSVLFKCAVFTTALYAIMSLKGTYLSSFKWCIQCLPLVCAVNHTIKIDFGNLLFIWVFLWLQNESVPLKKCAQYLLIVMKRCDLKSFKPWWITTLAVFGGSRWKDTFCTTSNKTTDILWGLSCNGSWNKTNTPKSVEFGTTAIDGMKILQKTKTNVYGNKGCNNSLTQLITSIMKKFIDMKIDVAKNRFL